jgi:hypothetical protein
MNFVLEQYEIWMRSCNAQNYWQFSTVALERVSLHSGVRFTLVFRVRRENVKNGGVAVLVVVAE